MESLSSTVPGILGTRDVMLRKQSELYVNAIKQLNIQTRDLLKNDFGSTLVKNCANDVAGEIVRRYFDTGDFYVTVDQMYRRIVAFSYDNDFDPLNTEEIRKSLYNFNDNPEASKTLQEISNTCRDAQHRLFEENRHQDKLDQQRRKDYREGKIDSSGMLHDDLTGKPGEVKPITRNGKEVLVSDIHADHVQSRNAASYNKQYTTAAGVEELKKFWNSDINFQLMYASANTSKGDIRVCEIDGKIQYLTIKDSRYNQECDITYKATPEQLTDAIVQQWEKETDSHDKTTELKKQEYLDKNGKVKASVRAKLEKKIRASQNAESVVLLKNPKNINYGNAGKDAMGATAKSFGKILCGQIIYYTLPPIIFETQRIIKRKGMTLDVFWGELKRAGKRVIDYVTSKLGAIRSNAFSNSISKFFKTFFDIIIETVKATVKKLMKIVKQIVMSLVNCAKILLDKTASAAQKADAITKTLSVAVTAVVVELLMEYLEKQFGLPVILMEPLQVIVSILATNVIMLVLQKLDLFDVQYGLLVVNIERAFSDVYSAYQEESQLIFTEYTDQIEQYMQVVQQQIVEIQHSIESMDFYQVEVTAELEKLNRLFNMEIDFNREWKEFVVA